MGQARTWQNMISHLEIGFGESSFAKAQLFAEEHQLYSL